MAEQIRENFFLAVRIGLLLSLEVYIVLSQYSLLGASPKMLLVLALFATATASMELVKQRWKWLILIVMGILAFYITLTFGKAFTLLLIFGGFEILHYRNPPMGFYFLPIVFGFISSEVGEYIQVLVAILLAALYIQNDFIVKSYRKQTTEDTIQEQHLKRNMYDKEVEMQDKMNRGLLQAENQHLEERAKLSQTLHDKLGHNINGSIYQLEATKVLMDKDTEKSRAMVQRVIDQLRTGMDEIREILRKERPEKYRFAVIQLENLCKDCEAKGIQTEMHIEGNLSVVGEKYLEIILDNAYEAVSNSMKYAKCSKIEIRIHVMNQLVRCSIRDNGIGCENIVDGMGLSGMRKRMREVNGILNFETESGFKVNMLLPLEASTARGGVENR